VLPVFILAPAWLYITLLQQHAIASMQPIAKEFAAGAAVEWLQRMKEIQTV
jgi:hypothetical protein